jgi:hypothetical protein
MYFFYCLIIIMIYNMILSNVYVLFVQLPLFFIIRVNPYFNSSGLLFPPNSPA